MANAYAVFALVFLGVMLWLIHVEAGTLMAAAVLGLLYIAAHFVVRVIKSRRR